ncbi:protein of unknown function [Taphrina deformans PYCC 5710]|uniref:Uncharacterized protein n=1 Tax=Taphrina deformans (strain PYCC 5710 / ATCC 11124 / CBS 356.35 / IMI 108563 / JCM 9778 / NBRC 8474) TaxID=1097556 RepID=R4XBA3_TAPDE|nr:protein of unknown function [Taphrina deformans PYCC 5710]|eukprot:CCG80608.1 protein of unknown function [Taphrina deformans PYCC 5710]
MVASIRRIDTACIRHFVTHHARATPTATAAAAPTTATAVAAAKRSYDMMNTAQVSTVLASLSTASHRANKQATETIKTYHARVREVPAQAQAPTRNGSVNATQRRLVALHHSSVSQDISALLKWTTSSSSSSSSLDALRLPDTEGSHVAGGGAAAKSRWVVERGQGNFEVGVRELARMGAFGRDRAASRLMELAL